MPNLPSLTELLQDLVRCPSVNPKVPGIARDLSGEARMVDLLEKLLHPYADHIERPVVSPGRENLIARFDGPRGAPVFALEAHTDTVGIEGMTIDPFAATLYDGRIHGRGACDTKGPMAAMLTALLDLRANGTTLPATWYFLAVCDEELGGSGARALAASLPLDGIIVGEPTDNTIVESHKGAYRYRIELQGKSAHSAYPEHGVHAIHAGARLIQNLESRIRQIAKSAGENPLGPPTLSVGLFRGGDQVNRIPESAVLEIDCRSLPGEPESTYRTLIREAIETTAAHYPGLEHQLIVTQAYPGYRLQAKGPFASLLATLEQASGSGRTQARYTTDAGFYTEAGLPAVVFGPGSIQKAHTADEWIDITELERGAATYKKCLSEFNNGTAEHP